MAKRTKNGTVYARSFDHPMTREGATVKATIRDNGEWIVRAYTGSTDVDGPYAILRTTDIQAARAQWSRIVADFARQGFEARV